MLLLGEALFTLAALVSALWLAKCRVETCLENRLEDVSGDNRAAEEDV